MKSKQHKEQLERLFSVAITIQKHGWLGPGLILKAQPDSFVVSQEATKFWYKHMQ